MRQRVALTFACLLLAAPAAAGDARPVVRVFHGVGGGAEWIANRSTSLTRTHSGAGYIVLYMNGFSRQGTEKRRTSTAIHSHAYAAKKTNDAAYADTVIEELDRRLDIHRTRLFLMGRSNGAMLSDRIADQMETFPRAIAAISGATFADQPDVPDSTSIFMYHAVDDEVLSDDGHPDNKAERWRTAPHVGFVKAEAKRAEVKTCGAPVASGTDGGMRNTERACPGSSTLVAVTAPSGGHERPANAPGYRIEDALLAFFERQH